MTEQTTFQDGTPTLEPPQADPTTGGPSSGTGGAAGPGNGGRDWLAQLQSMIENIAEQAAPVAKEVAAKAAELAAVAAEKAGPLAQKAAEVTADAGVKFAEKSRSLATELRKDLEAHGGGDGADGAQPAATAEVSAANVVPAEGDPAAGRTTIEG